MTDTPAEFCPMVPEPLQPLGHAWMQTLLLDGVTVDRCVRCAASRVTLAGGLGAFLNAWGEHVLTQRTTDWNNGYAYAASLPCGHESPTGPNQEHAQKRPWTTPRVTTALALEGHRTPAGALHWKPRGR